MWEHTSRCLCSGEDVTNALDALSTAAASLGAGSSFCPVTLSHNTYDEDTCVNKAAQVSVCHVLRKATCARGEKSSYCHHHPGRSWRTGGNMMAQLRALCDSRSKKVRVAATATILD